MSSVQERGAVTLSGDRGQTPSSTLHVATRPRLPSNRTAFLLAAAIAAMVPLGLATWTFGRAYHDSEVGSADARMSGGSQVAAAEVNAAAAAATRWAATDAQSRTVQTALERGTVVSLTHDVVSASGKARVHATTETHSIIRVARNPDEQGQRRMKDSHAISEDAQSYSGMTDTRTMTSSIDLARVAARV